MRIMQILRNIAQQRRIHPKRTAVYIFGLSDTDLFPLACTVNFAQQERKEERKDIGTKVGQKRRREDLHTTRASYT